MDYKRVTPVVRGILNDYVDSVQKLLPHCMEGLYLHGSIALGAFSGRASDIDFITVVNRRLSHSDIDMLSIVHQNIAAKYHTPVLEGGYLQWGDIGKQESDIEPHPYYACSTMHAAGFCNQNPVTWFTLKHHGISVLGPEPGSLDFEVSETCLLAYVYNNMNSYWVQRAELLKRMAGDDTSLFTDEAVNEEIEWCVLGILRQFYTLREREIISKTGAGEYALCHLPWHWHPVIRQAIRIRRGENGHGPFLKQHVQDALSLMKYILQVSRELDPVNHLHPAQK